VTIPEQLYPSCYLLYARLRRFFLTVSSKTALSKKLATHIEKNYNALCLTTLRHA